MEFILINLLSCGFPSFYMGFPGGSDSKESACNARDLDSIPGLGRSPGDGSGYPLQYSGLENSKDRGAWWAIVHGVAESGTRLSIHAPQKRDLSSVSYILASALGIRERVVSCHLHIYRALPCAKCHVGAADSSESQGRCGPDIMELVF